MLLKEKISFYVSGRHILKNASIFKSSAWAPSPTIVKQLAAILTALAFHFGEGGPLAVEEVCRKIKITPVLRDVEVPSPTITFEFRDVEAPSPTITFEFRDVTLKVPSCFLSFISLYQKYYFVFGVLRRYRVNVV